MYVYIYIYIYIYIWRACARTSVYPYRSLGPSQGRGGGNFLDTASLLLKWGNAIGGALDGPETEEQRESASRCRVARDGLVPAWLVGRGPKLPGETGATSRLPGIPQLGVTLILGPVEPIARVMGREELNRLSKEQEAARIEVLRAAGRVTSGPSPGAADLAEGEAALTKWVPFVRVAAEAGAVKGTLPMRPSWPRSPECKATGAIMARGESLLLYLGWAKRQERRPFPVEEGVIFELRFATQQSPSHASRLLGVHAFMGYLFGVRVDDVLSARARGIALKGLKRKRETLMQDAVTVA